MSQKKLSFMTRLKNGSWIQLKKAIPNTDSPKRRVMIRGESTPLSFRKALGGLLQKLLGLKRIVPVLVLIGACIPLVLGSGVVSAGFFSVKSLDDLRNDSVSALKLKLKAPPKVIVDNDEAFVEKLSAIQKATSFIKMAYYIYSDDYSSSVITQALIEKAKQGVSVELLVDYHTNYKMLDLFAMMEQEGRPKLKVRFYNRPTKKILEDVVFMTMPCPGKTGQAQGKNASTECSDAKSKEIAKFFMGESLRRSDGSTSINNDDGALNYSNRSTLLSGLYLAGLYSKNGNAIQLAIQASGNMPKQPATQPDAKEIAQFKELMKLIAQAKLQNSLSAKIKLAMAMSLYGAQLAPVYNNITGLLPLERTGNSEASLDWEHLTDFLHHKILISDTGDGSDNISVQLGGRNIEDSYHMKPGPLMINPNNGKTKYNFRDTDVRVVLDKGSGEKVAKSYNEIFNFAPMVATLNEVYSHTNYLAGSNLEATAKAVQACQMLIKTEANDLSDSSSTKTKECFLNHFEGKSLSVLVNDRISQMEDRRKKYKESYLLKSIESWKPASSRSVLSELEAADVQNAVVSYIENLPFDRRLLVENRKRTYGGQLYNELSAGKGIHYFLPQAIETICEVSSKGQEKQDIVLHNAYFFPNSRLFQALANTINGGWDCHNVRLRIITNSPETTDLQIVNFFARGQLKSLMKYYARQRHAERSAQLEYYEYKVSEPALSLHTKATVLGQNVLIGSANADVRSYMMDSNNGFLIQEVPLFTTAYKAWIEKSKETGVIVDKGSDYKNMTDEEFDKGTKLWVDGLFMKYDRNGNIKEGSRKELYGLMKLLTADVVNMSEGVLDLNTVDVPNRYSDDDISRYNEQRAKLKSMMEDFDRIFKPI